MKENMESIDCSQKGFYQSPELEVIMISVEQGYAVSVNDDDQLPGWKPTYW